MAISLLFLWLEPAVPPPRSHRSPVEEEVAPASLPVNRDWTTARQGCAPCLPQGNRVGGLPRTTGPDQEQRRRSRMVRRGPPAASWRRGRSSAAGRAGRSARGLPTAGESASSRRRLALADDFPKVGILWSPPAPTPTTDRSGNSPSEQRKPLFGGPVQNPQVPARLPRALRLAPRRQKPLQRAFPLVQHRAPPLGYRLAHPRSGALPNIRRVAPETGRHSDGRLAPQPRTLPERTTRSPGLPPEVWINRPVQEEKGKTKRENKKGQVIFVN